MRVVIAEDSLLLRRGAIRLLEDAGFEVVGEAGTPTSCSTSCAPTHPDVAVVDIRMPPTHLDEGLQAARVIRAELPEVGVLMLSQYVEERYVTALLEQLMAEGKTNRAISQQLYMSERGVERHVTAIFTKLDLPVTDQDHRRVLAVLAYVKGA